jgi:ubiquitin carboxyl-terminal hydrolase 25/28
MDVDSPDVESERDKDGFVMVSSPISPLRSSTPQSPAEASASNAREVSKSREIVDVDMQDGSKLGDQLAQKTTSLSPRKAAGTSDSSMMFGKYDLLPQ